MKKTKKYKLLNQKIIISYIDKDTKEDGSWIFGHTRFEKDEAHVFISTKYSDDTEVPEDVMQLTLRHEIFHVLFYTLYYDDLGDNEHIVEWLAQAWTTLKKQKLEI